MMWEVLRKGTVPALRFRKPCDMSSPTPLDPWNVPTELATRLEARWDDESPESAAHPDIGRQVGPDQWELFVTCAAADALQLQFSLKQHCYLFVHGPHAAVGARYLTALAQERRRPLQHLRIRRQGHGDDLASLVWLELVQGEQPLRLMALEQCSVPQDWPGLVHVMLAHAVVRVVVFDAAAPEPPPVATAWLRDAVPSGAVMAHAPWVWVPWGAHAHERPWSTTWQTAMGLQLRRAPASPRAADAWPFLVSTWRLMADVRRPVAPISAEPQGSHTSSAVPGSTVRRGPVDPASIFKVAEPAAIPGAELPPLEFDMGRQPARAPDAPLAVKVLPGVSVAAPMGQPEAPRSVSPGAVASLPVSDGLRALIAALAGLSPKGGAVLLSRAQGRVAHAEGQAQEGLLPAMVPLLHQTWHRAQAQAMSAKVAHLSGQVLELGVDDARLCVREVPGEPDWLTVTLVRPVGSAAIAPWRAALDRVESSWRR